MRSSKAPAIFLGVISVVLVLVALPALLGRHGGARPAYAYGAPYRFEVPSFEMQVTVKPDASVAIDYTMVFRNLEGSHPIDMVDVGMPTRHYDPTEMVAFVDDRHVDGAIMQSPRVKTGVVVLLEGLAIQPGETKTFKLHAVIPNLVFNDTTSSKLASFQITPTWFDPRVVEGDTDLKVAVILPASVKPEQVLYQHRPFSEKAIFHGRTAAIWELPHARMTGPHMLGLSFPISSMKRVVRISKLELLARWWAASPLVRLIAAVLMLGLFALVFFRFSGKTGCSVWGVLTIGSGILFLVSPRAQLYLVVPWIIVLVLMEWATQKKRRDYLPPITNVEGGGIKRGLTAPEAAALLEVPLGKLVTLVIFGLLKKGVLLEKGTDPLVLEVAPGFKDESPAARRKQAATTGVVLQKYEDTFIDQVGKHDGKPVTEMDFAAAVKGLLHSAATRVSGFDVSDTKDYYRKIVDRAWKMAEDIGPIDQRTKTVDKNLEWMLIDHGYRHRFDHWGSSGFFYVPLWVRSPGVPIGSTAGVSSLGSGSGSGSSAPTFGDVAGSFAGWTENVTSGIAGAILPGAVAATNAAGGVINLSGFDHATSDIFQALASSSSGSGSGGGFSGGCACACAGCACACACAGGGV